MAEQERQLSIHRKRRGVVKASITRLQTRVTQLERVIDQPGTLDSAKQLLSKLESLDTDFRTHHLSIVDLTDDDTLGVVQDALDAHDDDVYRLGLRIRKVISARNATADASPRKVLSKRLLRLKTMLASVTTSLSALPDGPDQLVMLHQFQEQLAELKQELADVRSVLYTLDLEDSDELSALHAAAEKTLFDVSLDIKKRLSHHCETPTDIKGVKLPRIDVPMFDGNLLHWSTFWEQFEVAVHNKTNLSEAEKLVYLQHALKGGSAKQVIIGLSSLGDHYQEAVSCLKERYSRPRLIHQTHVRMIVEAPPLKDGTGREIRKLHDNVQQHLRALKSLGYDPPGPFIASLLELKLDTNTMFEWQRHSQSSADVPHYMDLLKFLDLRAQASESASSDTMKRSFRPEPLPCRASRHQPGKPVTTFATTVDTSMSCMACTKEKHPLYACSKFRALGRNDMLSIVKSGNLCLNCLHPGHQARDCRSSHRCMQCQRPHHTLLHVEPKGEPSQLQTPQNTSVSNHAMMPPKSRVLLMTCRVLVQAPDGSVRESRALLDSGSSASFVSERLAQSLCLPRQRQSTHISGIACIASNASSTSTTHFRVRSIHSPSRVFAVSALIVPKVTCDLPLHPVPCGLRWKHLTGLRLADPDFGTPGRIDLLLGVETFVEVMRNGRRFGAQGTPIAFDTHLGWVLAGSTDSQVPTERIAVHHASLLTGDDLIRRFWEIEEKSSPDHVPTVEEHTVMKHFQSHHSHLLDGRFVVPLPQKPHSPPLGESRSQAVRRFLSFERSLHSKGQFQEFKAVIDEYFEANHAEAVPVSDLDKPPRKVYYLPMHSVHKESSTTTKVRAVFDASAKTSTGISLNDTLLVGPTVHSSLIDVLLRFRLHRVALTADVSRMYRAIALTDEDKDLHRFVWRDAPQDPVRDYRMTRVTFGVSASSFIANMCVKQNALTHALQFPLAAKAVNDAFYVDDGVTGADSVAEAIELRHELQSLFSIAGFLLRKWNSSEPAVLQHIKPELRDSQSIRHIHDPEADYTKTLGVEWNVLLDHFRLATADLPPSNNVTKRALVSDIARTFDILGWFFPAIITVKILLQRVWEERTQWDEPVPSALHQVWSQWRLELPLLTDRHIPRCYFPKNAMVASLQLHGFSDASQLAYAGVVYMRAQDEHGNISTSLVISKTKVAPVKRLTIPRLELCGAHILAQLLHRCKTAFRLPPEQVFAWTDSTIVLNWITGSPRRFKTYVSNRVSHITELIAPERWRHVEGTDNPADCASRGLLPSELLNHHLWWDGPKWLQLDSALWPKLTHLPPNTTSEEGDEICLHIVTPQLDPIFPLDRYSSYTRLVRVTAWVIRFIQSCQAHKNKRVRLISPLTVPELRRAESYWILYAQEEHFSCEIGALNAGNKISRSSSLISLNPFLDQQGLLRVGGREQNSQRPYDAQHPLIIHSKHPIARQLIAFEHKRLLHAGPSLLSASLSRRFHLIRGRNTIRSITRRCVICRRKSSKPRPQMMGQLPPERVTPDAVFSTVGVDYAGPVYIKRGAIRRPVIIKAYVAIFVSLTVKAVHLEAVSDLTTESFLACLRRFVARRGKPTLIWSDHGSNFVGANRILADLYRFLRRPETEESIANFCSTQGITWDFIPERAPHFGGLWEAAVKSMKQHFSGIVGNVKLTFEELSTVLAQIEACLNSRPLVPLPIDDDGIQALTPGHFLIGRPLEALPDPTPISQPTSVLKRWHLCQSLVRHLWTRWSSEYLATMQKFQKWRFPSRNVTIGDIVVMKEDSLLPTRWPLARVINTHAGSDGLVRVATLKTSSGTYTRPVNKIVLLLPHES